MSGKTGKQAPQAMIDESYSMIRKSLELIEQKWFADNHKYMFGDMITIADLSLACELSNLEACGNY